MAEGDIPQEECTLSSKSNSRVPRANYIFYGIIIVTLILCLYVEIDGDRREQVLIKQYNDYLLARELITKMQYEEASVILSHLLQEDIYKESYPIVLSYGLAQGGLGNYADAYKYFIKAQEIRPMAILDYIYNVQVGEALYQLEEYEKAKEYLLRSQLITAEGQFAEAVNYMLEDIKLKTNVQTGEVDEEY